MNHKKDKNLNIFFLLIMATAGVQRFLNGLEVFELFESFANPLQRNLFFTFFIPPLYYLFFHNLIFKNTSSKRIVLHFTIPILIAILSSIFNPNLVILKAIFLLYSSAYIVFTGLLIREKLFQNKNYKELIHFQSIKNWTLIIFAFSFLIYFLANYIFLNYSNEEGQNVLINFYNITSLIWLFIIGYILKNPVILYGEQLLLEKINTSTKEEIEVWRNKKKGDSEKDDLEVEKKVKGKEEEMIFAIKKSEHELLQNFTDLPSLKQLAFKIDYPQSHLKYIFKYYTYCTFGEYQNILKVKYAMKLIQSGYLDTHTIDSLAIKCLFTNRSTFYKNFKKQTGFSPTEYQIDTSSN
ncbi:helix-turn-helix domain-containing protein [Mongoliibacter sp.]|uniref:helix-turn-helix domain-containing protein n=1 Tax=Mongoliibacter sp. TaxID=2022438 RepID=UPI0025D5B031|nr:AraC family transcriptional regulator [Mongoliibacter sp.]